MSATPLSDIQTVIERSLFEHIRLELVDKGYLPDVTDYPNTQVGYDDYNQAITDISNGTNGFAIELFNESENTSRGMKKVPRIVMNTGNFLPGALGGDPSPYFSDQGSIYTSKVTPPQTVDFFINFHLISNTVAQQRILNAILALAVPRRGYIPWYSDSDKTFFIRYLNYYDGDDQAEGILEKVYAYEIPDCWDSEDRDLVENVAKINRITLQPNVQKYMDGTWGQDTDPLVVNSP